MKKLIAFFLVVNSLLAVSQSNDSLFQNQLVKITFKDKINITPKNHALLTFKTRSAYFNPLTYLSAGVLFIYQTIFSEQIQAECAYAMSCSEFTKYSIQQQGLMFGIFSGFNQLSECAPNAIYEHEANAINANLKISISSEIYHK